MQDIVADVFYTNFLFPELHHTPFLLSAERFGISLFHKELDFTRNHLVNLLQRIADDKQRDHISPYELIDQTTSRYALPIKDNIDFTRDIPTLTKKRSPLFGKRYFNHIKDIMGGYYKASDNEFAFVSKARGDRRYAIPLHLASSSARGLSDLYFFLRHVASDKHVLMIDEPESHLDTSNQIALARLLARLTRTGLKIVITTHSDYLLKELK